VEARRGRRENDRVAAGRERTLTQRELNRALLARQLLLERVSLPLPRVLERIAGIQNQYAPNAYLRLWSCVEGFRPADLTAALERRSVVQATLMRSTIHLVSRRDYWPLVVAIREAQRDWWLRVTKPRPDERELEAAARELTRFLAAGPRRHDELAAAAGRGWARVGPWLDLVRVPPAGTWEQRRASLYQTAERWLGREDVDPESALELLVRRYLAAFGPASRSDLASWAGLKPGHVAPALERMRLRRFRDEDGGELVDLPRAPLPDPATPAPVRFLPTWDAVLLVHARRTQVLPERYRPLIFSTKTPPSFPTFLVDGAVAGTWRYVDGHVELTPFERLDRSTMRQLREEADALAAFHEDASRAQPVKRASSSPTSSAQRSARGSRTSVPPGERSARP
jgi:hypothetical protein